MKKGRPANTLSVLCPTNLAEQMKDVIFTNSTTIGLREYTIEKSVLRRKTKSVTTKYGTVQVKQSYYKGKLIRSKAEYEDCKQLAIKNNISLYEIEHEILKHA